MGFWYHEPPLLSRLMISMVAYPFVCTGVAELNEGVELELFQGTAVTKALLSFSYILAQGMSPKKIHEVLSSSRL